MILYEKKQNQKNQNPIKHNWRLNRHFHFFCKPKTQPYLQQFITFQIFNHSNGIFKLPLLNVPDSRKDLCVKPLSWCNYFSRPYFWLRLCFSEFKKDSGLSLLCKDHGNVSWTTMDWGHRLWLQVVKLFFCQFKHEVFGEAADISF